MEVGWWWYVCVVGDDCLLGWYVCDVLRCEVLCEMVDVG